MAHLIFAGGVPHTPQLPKMIKDNPGLPQAALYREVRRRLEAAAPDVLIVFTSDHLMAFFYDNLPTFCVGISDQAQGPEEWVEMPRYTVGLHEKLGAALHRAGLEADFDLAEAHEFVLDHSTLVPLHFLTPNMDLPIVPVFIKGLASPLPRAQRCYALGRLIGRFLRDWPEAAGVGVLASGSFSIEVGGPRMGWIDRAWSSTVSECIRRGETEDLLRQATEARIAAAGNAAGELLDWITLLGVVGDRKPAFLETGEGDAYAVWELK